MRFLSVSGLAGLLERLLLQNEITRTQSEEEAIHNLNIPHETHIIMPPPMAATPTNVQARVDIDRGRA